MRVNIEEGCIGCGLCEQTCPSVFQLGDDGFAHVAASPEKSEEDKAIEAQEGCPVSVIHCEE